MTNRKTWIALVDARAGRLLHGRPQPAGRYRLDEQDAIHNQWEQHQRGRPSPLSGKDGRSYASVGHEDEQMAQRFAKDVVKWLEKQTAKRDIDRLAVFAPPRFLGELRKAYPASLAGRIEEREGDYVNMRNGELLGNPAIREAIGFREQK